MLLFILVILVILVFIYLSTSSESYVDRIPCHKWLGDINTSPPNICKDCGYPIDCHGPYKGDSWRHIFRETPL